MLLNDVYWPLGQRKFDQYEHFVTAVTEYNEQISPGHNGWQPEREIFSTPITVTYEARWKDDDDLLELVIGESGQKLMMGIFLFELNNQSCEFFADADEHFFEGLDPKSQTEFSLIVGS
ncbi:hypothetical protein INH39_27460 [Massilia violaceinigra]|uniref:Uncharacterized protein n=1 Tax=Massilia violaceinigra TaxID=2045208 RepID=A0ABY4A2X4_9BURK|nr:hypothetical protein [Massilia violaceinigra]UOD29118.1 hypothetical protein INH39_27460 [Massilia violaceinigra]